MLIHSSFAPLGPHYLCFVKIEFTGSFFLIDVMPPPSLLHQILDELMVVSITHLIAIYLLFLVHDEVLVWHGFFAFICVFSCWTTFIGIFTIKSKTLTNYDTFINFARYSIFFIQYTMHKPHHLFFYLGHHPMVLETVKQRWSQNTLLLGQILDSHMMCQLQNPILFLFGKINNLTVFILACYYFLFER